ncbi:MAG: DUF350 domain-containing protein [Leptolyngbyaceae bacterium]|nr:DUF350 domain-containing protein [Leptolyngbyaceae bacterium]
MILPTLQKIGATISWTLISVCLLYGGIWLYDRIDPINYQEEVRRGNIAAGMVIATVILAIAAIIIAVIVT